MAGGQRDADVVLSMLLPAGGGSAENGCGKRTITDYNCRPGPNSPHPLRNNGRFAHHWIFSPKSPLFSPHPLRTYGNPFPVSPPRPRRPNKRIAASAASAIHPGSGTAVTETLSSRSAPVGSAP
jgi:hypothetical protein